MDDRFPSNSQQLPPRRRREDAEAKPEPQQKQVRRVVEGEVVRRKPSRTKRLKELIIGGDDVSIGEYLLLDILVPGIRDIMFDVFQTGLERKFYPDSDYRHGHRRPGRRGSGGGHVSYDRYSRPGRREDPRERDRDRDRDRDRGMSRRAREMHDFDEIILPDYAEAKEVLTQMYDLLEQFDEVTVADLYQLSGISSTPVDLKWGWDNLFGSRVVRTRGGYLLDLPRPEPLKD